MPHNKKFIRFREKSNFLSQENGVHNDPENPSSQEGGVAVYGNLKGNSIVFIEDSKEIWTHGNLYKSVNWSVLEDLGFNWEYKFYADDDILWFRVISNSKLLETEVQVNYLEFNNSHGDSVQDLSFGIDDMYLDDAYTLIIQIKVDTESSGIEVNSFNIQFNYKTASGWHEALLEV